MERSFLLQRGKIDLETGRFPLTLFTNGEASDGHIVDIAGLQVDAVTPMFINHNPDPVQRMGRLENPHKPGKKTVLGGARMTFDGVIDMKGDGAMPEIRRDIAQGIHVGDITSMSGRWDPIKAIPRASLPKGHYAFSDIEGGWETPMFFESARVLEGSIVGVPADAAAMIGRSQDLSKPEHVRKFYDVLVNGDPLSRDRALEALYVDAEKVEGWEEIACEDGKVFVPAGVARVWGQSIEPEDERTLEKLRGQLAAQEIEREQISFTGDEGMDEIKAHLAKLSEIADVLATGQVSDEDIAFAREIALRTREESTEVEPVSVPASEMTETVEPVSVPSVAATGRAEVALPELPSLQDRKARMKRRMLRTLAEKMGLVE